MHAYVCNACNVCMRAVCARVHRDHNDKPWDAITVEKVEVYRA